MLKAFLMAACVAVGSIGAAEVPGQAREACFWSQTMQIGADCQLKFINGQSVYICCVDY